MTTMADDGTTGVTLIDMGIAVTMVGLVAAGAVPLVIHSRDRAKQAAVLALADSARAALAAVATADPNHLFSVRRGDMSATRATDGTTMPAGTAVDDTPVGATFGADDRLTIRDTTSGKAACTTPNAVVQEACALSRPAPTDGALPWPAPHASCRLMLHPTG